MTEQHAPLTIDLNADVGESLVSDAPLMSFITSANIACGGHAGDARTMRAVLQLAREHGVSAGAHPSYPDRGNFGRTEMEMPAPELERVLTEQISALAKEAASLGVKLRHVKPHGALYHAASRNAETAQAIARAALACDASLILVGLAGAPVLETWRAMGAEVAAEAFADRVYEANGSLRSRNLAGALVYSAEAAARQAVSIVRDHRVQASSGEQVPVAAQTVCLHSDTPGAADFAREVRRALEAAGCALRPL